MLFATKPDLFWIHTDAHISLSAVKVGTLMQAPAPAPITLRLALWVVSVHLHLSSSLRGWMEKAGFQPSLFNKDISI